MKRLIDNIIRDDEVMKSKILKLRNIKTLGNEFAKEENKKLEEVKILGEEVKYSPNMRMLLMVSALERAFGK